MKTVAQGHAKVLSKAIDYQSDPLALYASICQVGDKAHTMLLDSAEIDSKLHTKSLMLIDAALRFECNGRQVTVNALSANGQSVLPFIQQELARKAVISGDNKCLTATFEMPQNGLDEESRLKANSPFDALRSVVDSIQTESDEPNAVFLGGVFAYDMIASIEDLPQVPDGENSCPDFVFYLAETLLHIDHVQQQSHLVASIFGGEFAQSVELGMSQRIAQIKTLASDATLHYASSGQQSTNNDVAVSMDDTTFRNHVDALKHNIFIGDIFQVVPSRTFSLACPDSLLAYQALRISNPSPYMFFMHDADFTLFGASPECAVKFDSDSRDVEVYPIAGTRRRGFNEDGSINADLDGRIELELRLDKKELSEHLMLVDLARNDVARISEPGTRHIADLLKVDRYSHVMHLVSRVVGKLRQDLDALYAYQACMNMGTLTGAPKIRASQLIRSVEQERRGSYGGAVGYINGTGSMDTCIVIRSAFVKNQVAHVQAGAGVVYDSDPQSEADETRSKAQAVINAIRHANQQISNHEGAQTHE
ncbi:anthranilate synthase component 1 [Echinimonas agarilytica]|uniref:Anthranilate synthase component 1 n=1 Tax=Echinimonas agarilytica TaxID=1215918 RepID=A0AA42B737_9GAMM|nr:anthranilate synthase component 1 [Echinimonas agarilytica]MCM2679492.1 anthranilate synthase component 1 [Echinimonas agarilytica]